LLELNQRHESGTTETLQKLQICGIIGTVGVFAFMQSHRLLVPFSLAVVSAIVMVACGGGASQSSTTSTGSPSGCIEGQYYPGTTVCVSDAQCETDSYCNPNLCAGGGICIGGHIGGSLCGASCDRYPTDCTTAGSAIVSQLTNSQCTVMVRVNASTDATVGYAVNCGKPTNPTASGLLNQLMSMNSINWSGATALTSTQTTGVIAFTVTNGAALYAAYFSAATGNQLLMTQTLDADAGTSGFRSEVTWRDPVELGTACASCRYIQPVSFGSNISQIDLGAASTPVEQTNLIQALRINQYPIDSVSVTLIDVGQPEFLLFINVHCVNC
jgi:hypothetical protein